MAIVNKFILKGESKQLIEELNRAEEAYKSNLNTVKTVTENINEAELKQLALTKKVNNAKIALTKQINLERIAKQELKALDKNSLAYATQKEVITSLAETKNRINDIVEARKEKLQLTKNEIQELKLEKKAITSNSNLLKESIALTKEKIKANKDNLNAMTFSISKQDLLNRKIEKENEARVKQLKEIKKNIIERTKETEALKNSILVYSKAEQVERKYSEQRKEALRAYNKGIITKEELKKATKNLADAEKVEVQAVNDGTNALVRKLRQMETMVVAFYALKRGYDATLGRGHEFNKLIETETVGLKLLIAQNLRNVDVNGRAVTALEKFEYAQTEANKAIKIAREINVQTPHTLGETLQIYKLLTPQVLRLGGSLEDVGKITKNVSVVGASMGIEFQQLLKTVDSLMSGEMQESGLKRAMEQFGITQKEVNKTIQNGGDVVELFIEKLKQVDPATIAISKTWQGATAQFINQWDELWGYVQKPMFEAFKSDLVGASKALKDNKDDIESVIDATREVSGYIVTGAEVWATYTLAVWASNKALSTTGATALVTKEMVLGLTRSLWAFGKANAPLLLIAGAFEMMHYFTRKEEKAIEDLRKTVRLTTTDLIKMTNANIDATKAKIDIGIEKAVAKGKSLAKLMTSLSKGDVGFVYKDGAENLSFMDRILDNKEEQLETTRKQIKENKELLSGLLEEKSKIQSITKTQKEQISTREKLKDTLLEYNLELTKLKDKELAFEAQGKKIPESLAKKLSDAEKNVSSLTKKLGKLNKNLKDSVSDDTKISYKQAPIPDTVIAKYEEYTKKEQKDLTLKQEIAKLDKEKLKIETYLSGKNGTIGEDDRLKYEKAISLVINNRRLKSKELLELDKKETDSIYREKNKAIEQQEKAQRELAKAKKEALGLDLQTLKIEKLRYQLDGGTFSKLDVLKDDLALLQKQSKELYNQKDINNNTIKQLEKKIAITKEIEAQNKKAEEQARKEVQDRYELDNLNLSLLMTNSELNNMALSEVETLQKELEILHSIDGQAVTEKDALRHKIEIRQKELEISKELKKSEEDRMKLLSDQAYFKNDVKTAQGYVPDYEEQAKQQADEAIKALNAKAIDLKMPLLTDKEKENITKFVKYETIPTFSKGIADGFGIDTNKGLKDAIFDIQYLLGQGISGAFDNVLANLKDGMSLSSAVTVGLNEQASSMYDEMKNSSNPYVAGAGYAVDVIEAIGTDLIDLETNRNEENKAILKANETLNDVMFPHLEYTKKMSAHLENMDRSFTSLAIGLGRDGFASGRSWEDKISGGGSKIGFSDLGDFGGVLEGIGNFILGSKTTLKKAGLEFRQQLLSDALESVDIASYQLVNTQRSVFGINYSNSDSMRYSNVDSQFQRDMDNVISTGYTTVIDSMEALGLAGIESLKNSVVFDKENLDFKGKSDEEIKALLEAELGHRLDQIAEAGATQLTTKTIHLGSLFGDIVLLTTENVLDKFMEVGDGYYDTMMRVATQLEQGKAKVAEIRAANFSFDDLKGNKDLGYINADTSSYISSILSEQERLEISTNRLKDLYASVNLELPKSREEFKNLVQGLDLTTEAGREQYATLMDSASAFAQYRDAYNSLNAETETTITNLDKLKDVLKQYNEINTNYLDFVATYDMSSTEKLTYQIKNLENSMGVANVTFANFGDTFSSLKSKVEAGEVSEDALKNWSELNGLLQQRYDLERKNEEERIKALEDERSTIRSSMESIINDKISSIRSDYDSRNSTIDSLKSSMSSYAPEKTIYSSDIYSAIGNWSLEANNDIENNIKAWNTQQKNMLKEQDDKAKKAWEDEKKRLEDAENLRVKNANIAIDNTNKQIQANNALADSISKLKGNVAKTFNDLYGTSVSALETSFYTALNNKDYDNIGSAFSSFATATKESNISDVDAYLKIAYANRDVQNLVEPEKRTELEHIEAKTIEIADYVSTLEEDNKKIDASTVTMYEALIKQNNEHLPNVQEEIKKLFEQNAQYFDVGSDFYKFLERGATELTYVQKMDEQNELWRANQNEAREFNQKNLGALEKIDLSFNRYASATQTKINANTNKTKVLEKKLDDLLKAQNKANTLAEQRLTEQKKANEIAKETSENTKERVM